MVHVQWSYIVMTLSLDKGICTEDYIKEEQCSLPDHLVWTCLLPGYHSGPIFDPSWGLIIERGRYEYDPHPSPCEPCASHVHALVYFPCYAGFASSESYHTVGLPLCAFIAHLDILFALWPSVPPGPSGSIFTYCVYWLVLLRMNVTQGICFPLLLVKLFSLVYVLLLAGRSKIIQVGIYSHSQGGVSSPFLGKAHPLWEDKCDKRNKIP